MVNSCTRQSARWDTESVAARCAHCEPGGCIGRFGGGGFKAGERATPTRGQGAGMARAEAQAGARRARRAEIDADLTRYEYNVDIATYVSGLDTRCILQWKKKAGKIKILGREGDGGCGIDHLGGGGGAGGANLPAAQGTPTRGNA